MSLWSRIMLLLRVGSAAALDRAEDPREVLGYVDEQQLLRKLRQGLIEVAISKRQLQQQVEKRHVRVPQTEDQARRLKESLPSEVQEVIDRHEAAGTTDDATYAEATMAFYTQWLCRLNPFPEHVM